MPAPRRHVIVDGTKPCGACKTWKPLASFKHCKRAPTGYEWDCTPCQQERSNRSYRKHAARCNERSRLWKERNSEKIRDNYFRRYYGISATEYDAMLAAQGGVCAICRQPETTVWLRRTGKPRNMCVDHDHETGRVRGVLCGLCNTGIGALKHDPAKLQKAIDYLTKRPDVIVAVA